MKIVIVEDDLWIAKLLRQAISGLAPEAELSVFTSVGRAVNHIKADPLDLLLSDLNLPDGSGLEVIRAAKRRNPGCPRGLITSSIDRATVLAAIHTLLQHLKIPFLIRELIGPLFKLPQGSLRKDRVIMRIAALETGLDDDPAQLRQLRQWVGLADA